MVTPDVFSSRCMEVEDSSWPYICVSRNPADDGDPLSTNLKNYPTKAKYDGCELPTTNIRPYTYHSEPFFSLTVEFGFEFRVENW